MAKINDTTPKDILHKELQQSTKDEIVTLILELYDNYPAVKKQFDSEIKMNEQLGDDDKLKKEAKQIIRDTFEQDSRYRSRRHHYDDPEEMPDFDDLHDFISRLKKHPDPFEIFRYISVELIPAIDNWYNDHYIDEGWELSCIFITLAEAALAHANKDDVEKYYKWGDELNAIDCNYCHASECIATIEKFAWNKRGYKAFSDTLCEGFSKKANCEDFRYIRRFADIMAKAGRGKELTDMLRPLSKPDGVAGIFVKQLVEEKMFDEALARMQSEYLAGTSGYGYGGWFSGLTKLAKERRKWPLLASVYANELFRKPGVNLITGLLDAAKKLNVSCPAIRKSVTKYLETGMVPDAVVQTSENKKPNVTAKKNWPLDVMQGDKRKFDVKPHVDLLCEWAIDENRAKDAILWYKKCSASDQGRHSIPLANIIWEADTQLAIEIYTKSAMKIVDATDRHSYGTAAAYLGKAKKLYEQMGRVSEGSAFIEKIRSENKRKPAFIGELDKMLKRSNAGTTRR